MIVTTGYITQKWLELRHFWKEFTTSMEVYVV